MMKNLILENEKRIETFDIKTYLKRKEYPIASALAALETTNEVQKCYFDQEDSSVPFNVLKLYAVLQSLFVSVDSLYALSYSLTKSKSFININKNPYLRELKYIRNDIVGHPATRILNSDTLAYCILKDTSVKKFSFSYTIYSGQGVEEKNVDLNQLVTAFYEESNSFLEQLYQIAEEDLNKEGLINIIRSAIDTYEMGGDYLSQIQLLKEKYLELYPNATSSQHRLLWRIELIEKLLGFEHYSQNVMDLVKYSIGLELIKIFELFSHQDCPLSLQKRNPYLVTSFYRFLNKNPKFIPIVSNMYDAKNPLLSSTIKEVFKFAEEKSLKGVLEYIDLLKILYETNEEELLYALALPLKSYQQK